MSQTDSDSIRETFLRYFTERGHARIDGSSILPVNDPTLLFINSGMAPLKKYFTGEKKPPSTDLCNVQGCIRTKDIDDVGDRRHITFFEMLGSWSIGGYFKEHATELAWDLFTSELKLDPRRLYVTVFAGDPDLGLPADEESATAWERVGVPRDHIVALPAEDNFWGPAGTNGPCGPCTEVFLDTGEQFGPAYTPGGAFDTDRYVEIWNAGVFMQFDKGIDGVLRPLPFTSVDTGCGIERLQFALNGLESIYETDLLAPLVTAVQGTLGESGEVLHHHRVITDHMRAAVAILAENVKPTNEGRGYIPRRLIRKCMTLALSQGHASFDPEPIVHAVIDRMERYYPVWGARRAEIAGEAARECAEFDRTVRRGLDQLDRVLDRHSEISGADAFQLFATYGLPIEITAELAAARGVQVDRSGFEERFDRHRILSRGEAAESDGPRRTRTTDVLPTALASVPKTAFLGYDALDSEGRVLAILADGASVDHAAEGTEVDLITDRTPFYAEGGGQVGDRGSITAPGGRGEVTGTVAHDSGRYLHRVLVTSGELRCGDTVTLAVDATARMMTAANHTATHLLNAALRKILGEHVRQAGSLVDPQRLRFDFTHPRNLDKSELATIERLVNEWVLADAARTVELMAPAEAIAAGATSLAEEDYGDEVRVLSFDGFSKELCGGTHVDHTSLIGSFRIVSEQSVASGIRRIVAVTRERAVDLTLDQSNALSDVASALHASPYELVPAVERLSRSAKTATSDNSVVVTNRWESTLGGVPVTLVEATGAQGGLRKEVQRVSSEGDRVTLLWAPAGDRTNLVVSVPDRYRDRFGADTLLTRAAQRFGGAGGGNARIAQGGLRTAPTAESLTKVVTEAIDGSEAD